MKDKEIRIRVDQKTLDYARDRLGSTDLSTVTRRLILLWTQSESLQRDVLLLNADSVGELCLS